MVVITEEQPMCGLYNPAILPTNLDMLSSV